MHLKLRPSATVDVIVRNQVGEIIASPTTHNALKINVIQDFGKGLFTQRFTVRLGDSSTPTTFEDVFMQSPKALIDDPIWPTANNASVWPIATVNNNTIDWFTIQRFDISHGSYVGVLRELGFNFYGDQSDVIHARAILPEDLIIDETYAIEIIYKLTLRAPFEEISYIANSNRNGVMASHTVTQRWARRTTLWNILGVPPIANNCKVYSGQLNGYDVEPDGYLSQSFVTSVELLSDTSFSLESKFGTDDANIGAGIQSITWDTIPIKMSFSPPIYKNIETDLVFKITWELSA